MPSVDSTLAQGVLRAGWNAMVDDYGIDGGWADGEGLLTVADAAGGVHAFDRESGRPRWASRNVHEGRIETAALDPSGRLFATAGQDGWVFIWNVHDGRACRSVDVSSRSVDSLAWSPDGRWLAAASGRVACILDRAGDEQWKSPEHSSTVVAVAWVGNEELATACHGAVTLYQMPTGKEVERFEWEGLPTSMVVSPNGRVVACGCQDRSVRFWRRSTKQGSAISGYVRKPSVLAFDPKSTWLATGGGDSVSLWDFRKGPEGTWPHVLELHMQPISALAFNSNGSRLASGARDGAVVVWAMRRGDAAEPVGAAASADVITKLRWGSGDRALAALNASGCVHVWKVRR